MTALAARARKLGQREFILMVAMLTATVAFSIDSMMPALPEIAAELSPGAPNNAQLILSIFLLGIGIGTFVTGPLADTLGRRPVIVGGAVVYCAGALLAWQAPTLELMLAARFLQGLGAAGPRVATFAMVRDLHGGRDMARILSFIMMVFSLVPAIAPSGGALIIALAGWRTIFPVFVVFSGISVAWLLLRQPETLAAENRRPLRPGLLWAATLEVLSHPATRLSIAVQALCLGGLFSLLSASQQIFAISFDRAATFPLWFGLTAILASSASFLNAKIVHRFGMRALIKGMLTVQVGISGVMILGTLAGPPPPWGFALFWIWMLSVFFQNGLTLGNLNALAMEPLAHIAGVAASVVSALATMGAVAIAIPVGLSFDGSPLPIAIGTLVCAALGVAFTARIRRESDL